MKRSFLVGIALMCLVTFGCDISGTSNTSTSKPRPSSNQVILERELAYLKNINEVAWVKFENNKVTIGVNSVPSDIRSVAQAAAMIGNRAINFGVHVWVAPANNPNSYYGMTTARHGKIETPYGR